MHNNYYYFQHLSATLHHRLKGMELATCFSQNRDELVLGFCHTHSELWMKALTHSSLSAISFPDDFHRAKQNSVDLMREAIGKVVEQVYVFENERAWAIAFEEQYTLVFKLFGNRSNIILYKGEEPLEVFRKQQKQDLSVPLQHYHRKIDQSYEAFSQNGLRATYPTLGKDGKQFLLDNGYEEQESAAQWKLIQGLLKAMKQPDFYVGELGGLPKLWLFKPSVSTEVLHDAMEAANAFFYRYAKVFYLEKEQQEAVKVLRHKIKSTWSYIEKTTDKQDELLHNARYEEIGHIIMANLHQIPARAEKAVLHDFYRDQPISIKLNPELSPQKNAEKFYRKAKNQKIELAKLAENIAQKEEQLQELEEHIAKIESFEQVKPLRKYLKQHGLISLQQQEQVFPFRKFEYEGFEIWVGKNAKNNDLLTQQYAYKEDLWLHARDVAGSHVVVKYQAGKPFPIQVIEKAASLAAYYSVRKNDSLCPVIYTPKKYVRKPKGMAPGMVVVDKEEVVMMEPAPFNESLG